MYSERLLLAELCAAAGAPPFLEARLLQPTCSHATPTPSARPPAPTIATLQDQTWSISSGKALAESFTPTAGVSDDIKRALCG